jgi:hypothetical protein
MRRAVISGTYPGETVFPEFRLYIRLRKLSYVLLLGEFR